MIGVVALTGMVWQAVSNTREQAERDLSRALDQAGDRVRMLIQAAELTAASMERIARVPPVSAPTLRPALEQALAAFEQRPEFSYLGMVLPEYGEYGTLERTAEGRVLLWFHSGQRPGASGAQVFELTPEGFVLVSEQRESSYDPRERPFYQAALRAPAGGRWLPAYPWLVHTAPGMPLWGISYVRAVRDAQGQVLGVLDVDLDLPALNRFLGGVAAEYGVSLWLVERGDVPRRIGGAEVGAEPLPVPNAMLALASAAPQDMGRVTEMATLQGNTWAAAEVLTLAGGMEWVLVASRPAALIETPLRHQIYQVLAMGLALALGLALISVRMARRLARPLASLERSVERAGESGAAYALELEPVSASFRETRRLGDALLRMTQAARQREAALLVSKEQEVASLALRGAIFDATDTAIFSVDADLRVIEWNGGAERLFGISRHAALHQPIGELVQAADGPAPWSEMLGAEAVSLRQLHGPQGAFDAELRVVVVRPQGQWRSTVILNDVSARRRAERRLQQERDYADAVLNSLPGVFYHCDAQGRLQRWNRNLEHMTGADATRLQGVDILLLIPEDERKRARQKIAEVLTQGRVSFEADYAMPDGQRVPCLFTGVRFHHDDMHGFVGLGTDISDRKHAEQRLQHLASHDALTGLANRHFLQDQLAQAITRAGALAQPLAVLLLDLDRFKVVNDAYGHPFGDEVLKVIGARLRAVLGPADILARHGGDEFLILLGGLREGREAARVAQQVIEALQHPIALQGREIYLSGSVGVSLFPCDGTDAETLIRNADQAMYRAKQDGRNMFVSFNAELNRDMEQRVRLETDLRTALTAGQFSLSYQPKVSLRDGRILGCEALLRWQHPSLGWISPGQFIPVAEESGLIVPLSDWVLREACQQALAWEQAGLPCVAVAVNISAAQLLQHDLATWALGMLAETGLPAQWLELELTESLLAQDVPQMVHTFAQLKAAGIALSIDDFGTGYSSLSYLKNFHVDVLKIDQSFVRNMLTEPEDEMIVRAIITLAHNLKLRVIAEGVETAEQCQLLQALHCDEIQGYYFSKPVTPEAFEAMVREGARLPLPDLGDTGGTLA